jgi:hypothetical protein
MTAVSPTKDGARGRNRTGTDVTVRGILSSILPLALSSTIGHYRRKYYRLGHPGHFHSAACFLYPLDSSRKADAKLTPTRIRSGRHPKHEMTALCQRIRTPLRGSNPSIGNVLKVSLRELCGNWGAA